jgi:hypothetical protein
MPGGDEIRRQMRDWSREEPAPQFRLKQEADSMHLGRRPARGEKVLALRAGRWSNPEIRMLRIVRALADRLARLIQSLRALGPYAAIALALPGGTLIVLAMLGLRHRAAKLPHRVDAKDRIVCSDRFKSRDRGVERNRQVAPAASGGLAPSLDNRGALVRWNFS